MTLPSYRYGNPLTQLLNAEAKTCKGCHHDHSWVIGVEIKHLCAIGRKKRNSKCYVETAGRVYCEGGK